jgi:flavin-dependent dehydrogenase
MSESEANATDVFVVGGGPAGLAVAITARQCGFRVTVADGAQPPIDKACGEGFLPDGVEALAGLGIHVPLSEAYPFRGVRFLTSSRSRSAPLSAEAPFPDGGSGMAVRRTVLHRILIERAAQVGADLLWRTAVTGISHEGVQVGKRFVRARWIVGADGSSSRVRRWAGLESGAKPRHRYAFRRHFRVAPWTDHMEVYWGDRCQGYATAVSPEQVCVALASHDPGLRLEDGLCELPALSASLRGAEAVSAERGALTGNRKLDRVWRGNVALIGDASGTVDAITGEGLGLAFRQAAVLAGCFESCNLARYQVEHRRLAQRPRWMARMMLNLDGRPRLQQRTLQAFRKHPLVFPRLLGLHVGALPPLNLVRDGLTLGWGLLTA